MTTTTNKTNNNQGNIGEMNMEKKIIANDENIYSIVYSEIKRLGYKADLNHIDVSGVTDMEGLFDFNQFNGDISQWNVGNIKNMCRMFYKSQFNGDISQWNVSNVENMYWMFHGSQFNGDISQWKYNLKAIEEKPLNFILRKSGPHHPLIEKYVKALDNKKTLEEKIEFRNYILSKRHLRENKI